MRLRIISRFVPLLEDSVRCWFCSARLVSRVEWSLVLESESGHRFACHRCCLESRISVPLVAPKTQVRRWQEWSLPIEEAARLTLIYRSWVHDRESFQQYSTVLSLVDRAALDRYLQVMLRTHDNYHAAIVTNAMRAVWGAVE